VTNRNWSWRAASNLRAQLTCHERCHTAAQVLTQRSCGPLGSCAMRTPGLTLPSPGDGTDALLTRAKGGAFFFSFWEDLCQEWGFLSCLWKEPACRYSLVSSVLLSLGKRPIIMRNKCVWLYFSTWESHVLNYIFELSVCPYVKEGSFASAWWCKMSLLTFLSRKCILYF